MISVSGSGHAGDVRVVITNGGEHSPEAWAEMVAHRVISISDTAPEPIRAQAHAFRDNLLKTFGHYVTLAIRAEREACARLAAPESERVATLIRSR